MSLLTAHAPSGATAHDGTRPDPNRILAMAGVIAVHAAVLMVLLTPAAIEPPRPAPPEIVVQIPLPRIEPPPPLVPVVPVVTPPRPSPSRPRRNPAPVVPELRDPAPVDIAVPPDALDGVGTGTDAAMGDGLPDLTPIAGAHLAYLDAPAPRYPPKAVREGRSGTVLLEVTVDERGRPVTVRIARSSGHRDLDQAALRQVERAWRFQPAMRAGVAVRAVGLVPVDFRL